MKLKVIIIEIPGKVFIEQDAIRKMGNVADVFRGFVKSPDGAVELEVEVLLTTDTKLEVCVYIPEEENLTQKN